MEIRKLDTYAMIAASKQKDSDSEKLGAHAGSPLSRLEKIPWEMRPRARKSVFFMSGDVRMKARNRLMATHGLVI